MMTPGVADKIRLIILNKSYAIPNGCCGFEIYTDKSIENELERRFVKILEVYQGMDIDVKIFVLNYPMNFKYIKNKELEINDLDELPILIYENKILKGYKNVINFLRNI